MREASKTYHSLKSRYYFGAGPAALPQSVKAEAAAAILDYAATGLSILEIPHRGPHFDAILDESKQLVRSLCGLDEDWEVLWLQGGRLQFAMMPMNFLPEGKIAGYCVTGSWAEEAFQNAQILGAAEAVTSAKEEGYTHIPLLPHPLPKNLAYLHLTTNNTVEGTQWPELPDTAPVPLFADMSSDILSRARDYNRCSLFWAVVQKNLGAAGVTLVCMRKSLLESAKKDLPPMLSYAEHVEKKSVLNTAPVFAIYTALLMLRWTAARGIADIEEENKQKAAMLYEAIEGSPYFHAPATDAARSRMNVVFRGANKDIEQRFLQACEERGLMGLEGHRSAGGFRASLYNAIPLDAVKELVGVMDGFA